MRLEDSTSRSIRTGGAASDVRTLNIRRPRPSPQFRPRSRSTCVYEADSLFPLSNRNRRAPVAPETDRGTSASGAPPGREDRAASAPAPGRLASPFAQASVHPDSDSTADSLFAQKNEDRSPPRQSSLRCERTGTLQSARMRIPRMHREETDATRPRPFPFPARLSQRRPARRRSPR